MNSHELVGSGGFSLSSTGGNVGVAGPGEAAVSCLDLVASGADGDSEHVVEGRGGGFRRRSRAGGGNGEGTPESDYVGRGEWFSSD